MGESATLIREEIALYLLLVEKGRTKYSKIMESPNPMPLTAIIPGQYYENVILETFLVSGISRPRVRCVSTLPPDLLVEFPRDLREDYPIGTHFRATVKVCQKHWNEDGTPKGPPYLRATDIGLIVSSIPDAGLRAKIQSGSKSGRSYYYVWED